MDTDEILTGEGVLLDVRPASFASRLLGGLIDAAVYIALLYVVVNAANAVSSPFDVAAQAAIGITFVVAVYVAIPTAIETLSRGRSLGKLAAGVRIVRDDGGPVRFRQAFARALVGVFELWLTLGSLALITSMLNKRGKRLGDMLAGTYGVRVRGGEKAMPPVLMPPVMASWAAVADIGRLPDGLALAARQFLGRADKLTPASRRATGMDLAARMERHVAPPPPLGTHPEVFLAAVLAERRDREYAIELRHHQLVNAATARASRLPHGIADPAN